MQKWVGNYSTHLLALSESHGPMQTIYTWIPAQSSSTSSTLEVFNVLLYYVLLYYAAWASAPLGSVGLV
jgi:hypothetical protein